MPHAQPDDESITEIPSPLVRCPACGVRMRRAGPGCAKHGPIPDNDRAPDIASADRTGELPIAAGYRMVRWLGRGGFGIVIGAERESDGKLVAIKAALTETHEAAPRLLAEIEALSEIGAPTVPEVFDTGKLSNGAPYVVMELIASPTLAARLAEHAGPIPLPTAIPFVRGILNAIRRVHEKGLVHGDLKPENIFWREDNSATLIDFGLVAPAALPPNTPTSAGRFVAGTAEYMAPEQCEEGATLDVRTDIYALGIIFYEMFAGRPPFLGPRELVQQSHVSNRPPRLSTLAAIPPIVEDIILKCLQKHPEDRFQNVNELRKAMVQALDSDIVRVLIADDSLVPASASVRPSYLASSIATQQAPPSGAPSEIAGQGAARKRIRAALVFFETKAETPAVERILKAQGGELASAAGKRIVALFGNELDDNPARAALMGLRELIKRKVCQKARIDIASVSVQVRPNGARRFLSPLFTQADRFPTPDDPDGPWLSAAAAEVLSENDVRSIFDGPTNVLGAHRVDNESATVAEADDRGSIVGRESLLESLVTSAMEVVRGGPPSAFRVLGDEGLGKTHLAFVLSRRLTVRAPGARVISITGRALSAGEGVLANLLRTALVVPAKPPADGGREWLSAALEGTGYASTWPAIALALDFLRVDAPELRPLTSAPGALRSAMAFGAAALLRQATKKSPLLVLLDDAHLADEAALATLELTTLAESGASIWVLALGRSAFDQSKPNWGERAARSGTYTLSPLDDQSADELCRRLLLPATDIPEAAIKRIVARARAVPMLLVELIRGLKREGIVRPRSLGTSYFIATEEMDRLPDLPIVEWLAERELNSLADNLALHARLLSVLADDISVVEVEGILRRLDEMGEAANFPLDARAGTNRLVSLGILLRNPGGTLRFRHPLVREAIAHSTPEALRWQIHKVALDYYQSGNPPLTEELLLSRLAVHATGAGETVFAELTHLALADRAASRQRYLDAEIHYSRSIGLSNAPTFTAYRSRGLMRVRLGRHRDAIADFEAARALFASRRDPYAEADILLDEAEALDWADDYGKAEILVAQARRLLRSDCSQLLLVRVLSGEGRSLHRKSLNVEAAQKFELAIALAEVLGDEAYESIIVPLLLLGFILQGLGEMDRASAYLDRAVSLCEQHGDLLHLGPALSNRALLQGLLGNKVAMVEGYQRVAALARDLGQIFLELTTEFNLGEYLHLMNDMEGAEPHIRRTVAIEERRSGADKLPAVELLLARFELYRSNLGAAAEIALRVRARKAARQGEGDSFLSPSDDVLCSMIELATSNASDADWNELEARSARYSVGQERIEVLEHRGLAALRQGRVKEACLRLEKALALAERIPNCMRVRLRARLDEARSYLDGVRSYNA